MCLSRMLSELCWFMFFMCLLVVLLNVILIFVVSCFYVV